MRKLLVHKIVYPVLIFIVFVLLAIVIYLNHRNTTNDFYHLRLSGESPHWELDGYQVDLTSGILNSGNGKLRFKTRENDYTTNYFVFEMNAVINKKDITLQSKAVSGPEDFKNEIDTGAIEGPPPITKDGKSITFKDIDKIYAVIHWEGQDDGIAHKEIIDLYELDNKN